MPGQTASASRPCCGCCGGGVLPCWNTAEPLHSHFMCTPAPPLPALCLDARFPPPGADKAAGQPAQRALATEGGSSATPTSVNTYPSSSFASAAPSAAVAEWPAAGGPGAGAPTQAQAQTVTTGLPPTADERERSLAARIAAAGRGAAALAASVSASASGLSLSLSPAGGGGSELPPGMGGAGGGGGSVSMASTATEELLRLVGEGRGTLGSLAGAFGYGGVGAPATHTDDEDDATGVDVDSSSMGASPGPAVLGAAARAAEREWLATMRQVGQAGVVAGRPCASKRTDICKRRAICCVFHHQAVSHEPAPHTRAPAPSPVQVERLTLRSGGGSTGGPDAASGSPTSRRRWDVDDIAGQPASLTYQ